MNSFLIIKHACTATNTVMRIPGFRLVHFVRVHKPPYQPSVEYEQADSKPNSMNINNEKMTPFAVSAVAGKFISNVSKLVVIVVDVLIGLEQKLIM
ncbi:hypothetical protein T12_13887 [Trichinella patagoniensis]|uniref:Uncharacterized protein n=1 Tax=Trichinella patagoniensis TaxID=990121 RepID=A0A0V0ZSW8_9BILA|nr:hypothetical protein T12_13887 [Trichinella patagoniensis]